MKPIDVASRLHNDIDLRSWFGAHNWSVLRRFAVHGFITTQEDLEGFFERHPGSLKVLEMRWRDSIWQKVFKIMRRLLKLDDCKLRGLRNLNGDESHQWETAGDEEQA